MTIVSGSCGPATAVHQSAAVRLTGTEVWLQNAAMARRTNWLVGRVMECPSPKRLMTTGENGRPSLRGDSSSPAITAENSPSKIVGFVDVETCSLVFQGDIPKAACLLYSYVPLFRSELGTHRDGPNLNCRTGDKFPKYNLIVKAVSRSRGHFMPTSFSYLLQTLEVSLTMVVAKVMGPVRKF